MKKLIVLLVAVSLSAFAQAKSLREMWVSMPDSLVPTLDKSLRIEYIDLMDMGVKADVKNLLGEECVMDTLSSDYLQVNTSKIAVLQMKLLPQANGDSLLCLVKTFSAPEQESEVRFYDSQWNEVDRQQVLGVDAFRLEGYLKAKPDTMSDARYHELVSWIEPLMFAAELAHADNSITFRLSLPLVSKEEKMQLNAILMQRKFKWDGKMFKEI